MVRRIKWCLGDTLRFAIEEQQVIRLAVEHCRLVHDPARDAGVIVFRLLAKLGQGETVHLSTSHGKECQSRGCFQRGTAAETTADGDGRLHKGIKALQCMTRPFDSGHHATDVATPVAGAVRG